MTQIQSVETKKRGLFSWPNLAVILLFVLLMVIVGGWMLGYTAVRVPGDGSPEAGFARDMIDHHSQAVEMSFILYGRTEDEMIRILAYDIISTQQAQIGMMLGWLDLWGRTFGGTQPPMAWMDMPMDGPMPGMATQADINRLRELQGGEATALYIQLMILHHRGGVLMAEGVLARTNDPVVRNLAQSIVDSQTSEIATMQQLLQERGYPPVPDTPLMDHEGGTH